MHHPLKQLLLAATLPLAFVLITSGCRPGGPIKDPQTITVESAFSFQVPGDMTGVDAEGVDSLVGRFESPVMELDYDYGASANDLGNNAKPEFKITLLTVDGHEATIERFQDSASDSSFPLVAAIHFPDAGNGSALTMYARCADEDAQDLAVDIFRSIKFSEADS